MIDLYSSFLVTCPHLDILQNGHISSASIAVLSRVTFSCLSGYKLVGDNTTVCRIDSTWSNPVPQCKRKCLVMCNCYVHR